MGFDNLLRKDFNFVLTLIVYSIVSYTVANVHMDIILYSMAIFAEINCIELNIKP